MFVNGSTAIECAGGLKAGAEAGASAAGTERFGSTNLSTTKYPITRINKPLTIQGTNEREAGGIDRLDAAPIDDMGSADDRTLVAMGVVASGDSNRRTWSTKASVFAPAGRCVHCTSRNFSGTMACESEVPSMMIGCRKALPSAMSSVRATARFHSRRK